MNWQILSLITLLLIPVLQEPPAAPALHDHEVVGTAAALPQLPLNQTLDFDTVSLGLSKDLDEVFTGGRWAQRPQIVLESGDHMWDFRQNGFQQPSLDSVIFPVRFRPTDSGARGLLYVVSGLGNPGSSDLDSIQVTGFADQTVSIRQPMDSMNHFNDVIDFGEWSLRDTSDPVAIVLRNNESPSAQPFDIQGAVTSRSRTFSIQHNTQQGTRISIRPGTSETINVFFHPENPGAFVDSITIRTSFGYRTFILRGVGAAPQQSVSPTELFFESTAGCRLDTFRIENIGRRPLTFFNPVVLSDTRFEIVSPAGDSLPDLAPGSILEVVVRYCALDSAAYRLQIFTNSFEDSVITVDLRPANQNVPRPWLVVRPDKLEFGDVDVNSCKELALTVFNLGPRLLEIREPIVELLEGDSIASRSVDGLQLPRALLPGDSLQFIVTYCAYTKSPARAIWTVTSLDGDTVGIPITGQGELAVALRLDSTKADVGEILSLTGFLSAPIPSSVDPRNIELRLRYDPDALFPIDAVDAVSGESWQDSTSTGLLILRRRTNTGFKDSLVRIRFRGLSTGQERNLVEIESAYFETIAGGSISRVDMAIGAPGLVELVGCDIGNARGLDRRATIRGVSINGAEALLRYIAPEGSTALLTLTAVDGSVVQRVDLPTATSGEQLAPVDLSSVSPGFYILDLRVGDGRSSIPLMISR